MYRFLEIDSDRNMILCSMALVGKGELVEVYTPAQTTPSPALSNVLVKLGDEDEFVVRTSFNGHDAIGKTFSLGERCVLRILRRSLSGTRRRRHSLAEKSIVDTERDDNSRERKVSRAKTGSVRKKRKKSR